MFELIAEYLDIFLCVLDIYVYMYERMYTYFSCKGNSSTWFDSLIKAIELQLQWIRNCCLNLNII